MKKTNILYWVFTGMFGGFMLFSAIPDALVVQDAVDFITQLGYPKYIIPFLGVAKILGVVALIIPGYPRIKEWAYAGLFFDLAGACYSQVATEGLTLALLFWIFIFGFEALSYIYYHKRLSGQSKNIQGGIQSI